MIIPGVLEKYEKKAGVYDVREGIDRVILEDRLRGILEWVEGEKVLEIGCGSGLVLERIPKGGRTVFGSDISRGMVAVVKGKGLENTYPFLGDGLEGPFKGKGFDTVILTAVLQEVEDRLGFLGEIRRACRGRFICTVPNRHSPTKMYLRLREFLGLGRHPHYFSRREIRKLMELSGFEVESMRTVSHYPPILPWRARFTVGALKAVSGFLDGLSLPFGDSIIVIARPSRKGLK